MTDVPKNRLVRGVSSDGGVAARALVATDLVAEGARRHRTSPLASDALGRVLMGAVLLVSTGKGDETVQLRFSGDGPLGAVTAISDTQGRARGYATHPSADLPLAGGERDLPRGIGLGRLSAVRFAPGWREPYTGIVPIVSGTIAQDLALYLSESEQVPSAIALGVYLEAGRVVAAGGLLAQRLPDCGEAALEQLERNVAALPPLSELVRGGADADALLDLALQGLSPETLGEIHPAFECSCSEDRVLRAVALLGRAELDQDVRAGRHIEVRCAFCAEQYRVAPDRARELLRET